MLNNITLFLSPKMTKSSLQRCQEPRFHVSIGCVDVLTLRFPNINKCILHARMHAYAHSQYLHISTNCHPNTLSFFLCAAMAKPLFYLVIFLLFPFTILCMHLILEYTQFCSLNETNSFHFCIVGWLMYPNECNPRKIQIHQWPSGFAGLNVPKFTVQIINEAWHVGGVFDVQISCAAFASTTLINPTIFRRLSTGTCLLKNGSKIVPGEVITFEYSNLFPYPLNVLDIKCV